MRNLIDTKSRRITIILYEQQNGKCKHCGCSLYEQALTGDNVTLDHITPVSRGGADELDNLCLTCRWCNIVKSGRTLKEFQRYIQPWLDGVLPKEDLSDYSKLLKLQEKFKDFL